MKKKNSLYTFIAALLLSTLSIAQNNIVAGDLWVDSSFPSGYTQALINIYRELPGDPHSLKVDWGDGTIDTTHEGITLLSPYEGIVIDQYIAEHEYLHTGIYEITVQDSFLVDNITNIENSGEKYLTLSNKLRIREGGLPSSIAQFSGLALAIDESYSDQIVHPGIYYVSTFTPLDSFSENLIPFIDVDYTYPPASDTIICCRPLIWDSPTAPGRYAFGLQVSTWYQGELLGTGTRKMVIDVDSSMIVSTIPIPIQADVLLYPNPAHDFVNIEFGVQLTGHITIEGYTSNGVKLLEDEINLAARDVSIYRLDISNWVNGVYFIKIRSDAGKLAAKKLIISK